MNRRFGVHQRHGEMSAGDDCETASALENTNHPEVADHKSSSHPCCFVSPLKDTRQRTKLLLIVVILLLVIMPWLAKLYSIVNGRIDDDNNRSFSINDWILVSGAKDGPAIVMLTDGSQKVQKFQEESILEKAAYARHHNYTLICCRTSLDGNRPPNWSKLKLLYKILTETQYKTLFWLDVDTIIWDRKRTIGIPSEVSLMAQIDLHKTLESRYWNSGVFVLQKTDWILNVLRQSYRQWQIVVFQGIWYFNTDQEAMNRVMAVTEGYEKEVRLEPYGQLWTLPAGAFNHRKNNPPFIIHMPNCVKGRCAPEYLELHRTAMEQSVDVD